MTNKSRRRDDAASRACPALSLCVLWSPFLRNRKRGLLLQLEVAQMMQVDIPPLWLCERCAHGIPGGLDPSDERLCTHADVRAHAAGARQSFPTPVSWARQRGNGCGPDADKLENR